MVKRVKENKMDTVVIGPGKRLGNLKDAPTSKRPAPPKSQMLQKSPLFSSKQNSSDWVLNVIADPENPNFCLVEFPDDFVEFTGWEKGDQISVEIVPSGILLRKLN